MWVEKNGLNSDKATQTAAKRVWRALVHTFNHLFCSHYHACLCVGAVHEFSGLAGLDCKDKGVLYCHIRNLLCWMLHSVVSGGEGITLGGP